MDNGFSPTIPLSLNEEDENSDNSFYPRESIAISPTKSLNYSNDSHLSFISYNNNSLYDKIKNSSSDQASFDPKKKILQSEYSNSTIESFFTANSKISLEQLSSKESSQSHIFASLVENNNSALTLHPQKDPENNDSFETPKVDNEVTPRFHHESVYDRVNILQSTPTDKNSTTGLQPDEREFHSSSMPFLAEPLVKEPTSPIRAIRTSKLIHESDVTNTKKRFNSIKTIKADIINHNSYNPEEEDSFAFDNTINTIAFDNINISSNNSPARSRTSSIQPGNTSNENITNYAFLFISAIHSFNAASLEDKEDVQICLSFQENDIAFVHVADESGWGEVTLINEQKRGWVPLNYFTDVLQPDLVTDHSEDTFKQLTNYVESKVPLEDLLTACAKFLVDFDKSPELHKTLKIELINGIRNGVKNLLQLTECVSRSNLLVQNHPDVKKTRKKLLADWYNLMIKADHYKTSHSARNITAISILILEVLKRSFSFYETWGLAKLSEANTGILNFVELDEKPSETQNILIEEKSSQNISQTLTSPPYATERLAEIYDILFSYIGIIMGRLDMIEHNPEGCESLEFIVHQIIILLRELLYISKSCSYIIQEKYKYAYESTLDSNLDPLLSLVSELVSCIKNLITQTLHDDNKNVSSKTNLSPLDSEHYRYTPEGKHLIKIVSQMASLIKNVIFGCNSYTRLIGDFQLGDEREYRDFSRIRLTPESFIEKCRQTTMKQEPSTQKEGKYSKLARFSCIEPKFGNTDDKCMFLINPLDKDEKAFSRNSIFEKFKIDEDSQLEKEETSLLPINYKDIIQKEIVFDKDGSLIGTSFRAFVFKLTDELDKPDDLLIATFLLNFRKFGNVVDLVDELISRFDLVDKSSQFDIGRSNGSYSSRASRLKSRRRLVCSIFQKWMESFWDVQDYGILPTMVNFFNEGVSTQLPIESKNLIEIAARLFFIMTGTINQKDGLAYSHLDIFNQLKHCEMVSTRVLSVISEASSMSSLRSSVFSLDDRIIEQYGLTKTKSNRSQNRDSLQLPLLNIGESSLLNDDDLDMLTKSINFYETLSKLSLDCDIAKYDINKVLQLWNDLEKMDIPKTLLIERFNKPWLALPDLHPLEIAKQLTALESTLFLRIQPSELVNYKIPKLSPNITAIVKFTNQLSNYVTETVCAQQFTLQQKINRLKCWLKIALSCAYFRNFNSVAAIMTALQNHSIARLHPLWNTLDKKDSTLFDYLARIVHPNHNFKVYRTKLNSIIKDHQYTKSPLPVVPFFNLYLQDLTFLDDGNPKFRNPDSFRPNKLINTDKYIRMTKIIGNIQFFQVEYSQSSLDRLDNRDSFFQLTEQLSIDTNVIANIPILQEFVLFELWRINKYYEGDEDRGYKQSLSILPRT
ncbi:hypothetical protein MOSE0_J08262 [Monosporozyma servazzii]